MGLGAVLTPVGLFWVCILPRLDTLERCTNKIFQYAWSAETRSFWMLPNVSAPRSVWNVRDHADVSVSRKDRRRHLLLRLSHLLPVHSSLHPGFIFHVRGLSVGRIYLPSLSRCILFPSLRAVSLCFAWLWVGRQPIGVRSYLPRHPGTVHLLEVRGGDSAPQRICAGLIVVLEGNWLPHDSRGSQTLEDQQRLSPFCDLPLCLKNGVSYATTAYGWGD